MGSSIFFASMILFLRRTIKSLLLSFNISMENFPFSVAGIILPLSAYKKCLAGCSWQGSTRRAFSVFINLGKAYFSEALLPFTGNQLALKRLQFSHARYIFRQS